MQRAAITLSDVNRLATDLQAISQRAAEHERTRRFQELTFEVVREKFGIARDVEVWASDSDGQLLVTWQEAGQRRQELLSPAQCDELWQKVRSRYVRFYAPQYPFVAQ